MMNMQLSASVIRFLNLFEDEKQFQLVLKKRLDNFPNVQQVYFSAHVCGFNDPRVSITTTLIGLDVSLSDFLALTANASESCTTKELIRKLSELGGAKIHTRYMLLDTLTTSGVLLIICSIFFLAIGHLLLVMRA